MEWTSRGLFLEHNNHSNDDGVESRFFSFFFFLSLQLFSFFLLAPNTIFCMYVCMYVDGKCKTHVSLYFGVGGGLVDVLSTRWSSEGLGQPKYTICFSVSDLACRTHPGNRRMRSVFGADRDGSYTHHHPVVFILISLSSLFLPPSEHRNNVQTGYKNRRTGL